MECTPKRVKKVIVAEKEICTLKIQHKKHSIKQLFKLLSLVANAHPHQSSAPLIDSLVVDAVLRFSCDGDEALH